MSAFIVEVKCKKMKLANILRKILCLKVKFDVSLGRDKIGTKLATAVDTLFRFLLPYKRRRASFVSAPFSTLLILRDIFFWFGFVFLSSLSLAAFTSSIPTRFVVNLCYWRFTGTSIPRFPLCHNHPIYLLI